MNRSLLLLSLSLAVLIGALSSNAQSRAPDERSDASFSPSAADADATMDASARDAAADAGALGAEARARSSAMCAGGQRWVRVTSLQRELVAECQDGWQDCRTTAVFRVDNCSSLRVAVSDIRQRIEGSLWLWKRLERQWIEPGESDVVSEVRVGWFDAPVTFEVRVVDEWSVVVARLETTLVGRNVAREQAMEACRQCQGRWGRAGIRGIEGCNCRATDAGRACEDGADCEGLCVPAGVRVVTPAVPARCTCPAGCSCDSGARASSRRRSGRGFVCLATCTLERPAMVVSVGRCSEYRGNFGCRSFIPVGARSRPPRPSNILYAASMRCAD